MFVVSLICKTRANSEFPMTSIGAKLHLKFEVVCFSHEVVSNFTCDLKTT